MPKIRNPDSAEDPTPAAIAAAGPAACEAWQRFLSEYQGRAAAPLYRAVAVRFLRWLEPQEIVLAEVTPAQVQDFLGGLHVKGATRRVYRSGIRQFFEAMKAQGVISSNPVPALERAAGGTTGGSDEAKPTGSPSPLAELQEFLLELDRIKEGSVCYRPGLVAMYPIVVGGMDTQSIAADTGIPLAEVETYVGRLRENGVWSPDGKVVLDSADQDLAEFTVNLVYIVGCAEGVFKFFPAGNKDRPSGRKRNSAS